MHTLSGCKFPCNLVKNTQLNHWATETLDLVTKVNKTMQPSQSTVLCFQVFCALHGKGYIRGLQRIDDELVASRRLRWFQEDGTVVGSLLYNQYIIVLRKIYVADDASMAHLD